jgi:hypothetical protein
MVLQPRIIASAMEMTDNDVRILLADYLYNLLSASLSESLKLPVSLLLQF